MYLWALYLVCQEAACEGRPAVRGRDAVAERLDGVHVLDLAQQDSTWKTCLFWKYLLIMSCQLHFRVKFSMTTENCIESHPLFVGFVALKRSDSMFAAADDEEEGEEVGDDELAILSFYSVKILIAPQDSFKTSSNRVGLN